MNLPSKKELDAIDMADLMALCDKCPELSYMQERAGLNHYRLLRWISNVYPAALIYELGTYMGFSALCLADGINCKVITYDMAFGAVKWKTRPSNIEVRLADTEEYFDKSISNATIIFVDTWHNGIMERAVYDYLISVRWKGILIYDDIYYNDAMKEFWASIDHPGKIDATDIGHLTGTGIIEFI